MKTLKTIFAIFIFTFVINLSPSIGQKQKPFTEHNKYDTWIKLNNEQSYEGSLIDVRMDAIIIHDNNGVDLPFKYGSNVSYFELRKKGSITNGIIIGALGGAAIGGLYSYIGARPSEGEWDFQREGAIAGGLAGGIIGGLIGRLIGKTKIKININGNQYLNTEQLRRLKLQKLLTP